MYKLSGFFFSVILLVLPLSSCGEKKFFGDVVPKSTPPLVEKKEIKSINDSEIWLPDFFPIDVFIQRISELRKADNISLALDLFKIYDKLEGDNAKSLDEFLTWTPIIFSDFNDTCWRICLLLSFELSSTMMRCQLSHD